MEQAVSTILEQKGRKVVTIEPDVSLQEAAGVMNRESIGSLVVVDKGGEILGLLSERDIMRAFAAADKDIRRESVNRLMTPKEKLIIGQVDDTVAKLMTVMTHNQVRHIPIFSRDEPVRLEGMISIGDLVKSRLTDTHAENRLLRDYIIGRYPG